MKIALLCIILYHCLCMVNSEPIPVRGFSATGFAIGHAMGGSHNNDDDTDNSNWVCPPVPDTEQAPPPDTFSTDKPPTMTILYDAMEENSQKFFKTDFVKQYIAFSPYIDINLVTCQKAQHDIQTQTTTCDGGSMSTSTDSGGIKCPEIKGDPSCKLDILHACAIDQIKDKPKLINYLACTMSGVDKLPDFAACATQNNINDSDLQKCANSDKGTGLCKDHIGKRVNSMNVLPGFLFQKKDDVSAFDYFQRIYRYRSNVCTNDFHSAACAKLVAIQATSLPDDCKKKIVLGIFYNAMEKKSQDWFHLLAPLFDKFSDYFVFQYQPCMKANVNADNGDVDCKDQNDPGCIAGKTHACAVSLSNGNSKNLFQFLNCSMQDANKPDFQKCATNSKIPYDAIQNCANSDMGKNFCSEFSKMRPDIDDVPSFSYELNFDGDTSKKTADDIDLKAALCEQLKKYSVTLPPDCTSGNVMSN